MSCYSPGIHETRSTFTPISRKGTHRLDQLLRVRVKKFPGNTEEGNVLPCSIFDGQEYFVQFSINDIFMQCHVLSNAGEKLRYGDIRPKGLSSRNDAVTASTGSRSKDSSSSGTDAERRVSGSPRVGKTFQNRRTDNLNCEYCCREKSDGSKEGPNAHFNRCLRFFPFRLDPIYMSVLVQMVGVERSAE